MRRWDAVVVGARVAGASTAMLLARAGLRVLCVDRARHGSDTVSTHALMRGGVLQLKRWGLLDQVVRSGTPPVRRTRFVYGDDVLSVSIRPTAGVEALFAPRRTVLDPLLADAAREAGATVAFGTSVTGLERDPGGRVIGVRTVDRDGRRRLERADLVIGADGRRSLVADDVAAEFVVTGHATTSCVYGYWDGLDLDGYEWFYGLGGAAGVIPTNDGLACVFVGATPSTVTSLLRAGGPEAAVHGLSGRFTLGERLKGARQVGRLRHVTGTPGHLRRSHGPGWALVGDAGYWKDPLSTHGITAALRDAELLSQAVVDNAFHDYQQVRDALSLPMMSVAERIASWDWDMQQIRGLLMALSSEMADELEVLASMPVAA
ncbi:MAG: NAD(P)/FAD-dependent oxidoreductase [Candidatus Nanopelagicales bacterium]